MARLSAQNLSNPATPTSQRGRKSSRFKGLFKGDPLRSSLTPSTSTASPPMSPIEDIRPGFQKIGLLPSERPDAGINNKLRKKDSDSPHTSPGQSLLIEEQEPKAKSVPHNLNTNLGAQVYDIVKNDEDGKEVESTAADDMIKKSEDDYRCQTHESAQAFAMPSISRGAFFDILAEQENGYRSAVEERRESAAANSAKDGVHADSNLSLVPKDADGNAEVSNSPVAAHDADLVAQPEAPKKPLQTPGHPVPYPIPDSTTLNAVSKASTASMFSGAEEISAWTFGPLRISNARIASPLSKAVKFLYLFILFTEAFFGPANFLLAVWRLVLFFIAYELACHNLEWDEDGTVDIVVDPVTKGRIKLWKFFLKGVAIFVQDIMKIVQNAKKDAEQ